MDSDKENFQTQHNFVIVIQNQRRTQGKVLLNLMSSGMKSRENVIEDS